MANVAQGERPEDRVTQGMNDHVAIRMRNQPVAVRNAHPTQHYVIARTEGMHIETLANSHVCFRNSRQ